MFSYTLMPVNRVTWQRFRRQLLGIIVKEELEVNSVERGWMDGLRRGVTRDPRESMLLARTHHDILPSEEYGFGLKRAGARIRGLVRGSGSTNQRQDAIDRHVAPVGPLAAASGGGALRHPPTTPRG